MAGADLRGFEYGLEPIRRQRQWQFDAALAGLGKLQREAARWDAERDRLHGECVAQAARAAQVWTDRADPTAQARLLGYLAALQQRHADAEREIAALATRVDLARRECAAQQQRLEVLDQHRADTLKDYAVEQHRKAGAEADQEWVAQASHRAFGTEAA
ncbi:hypothetical protein [Ramlibacter sp. WS9]|uniref:hypothetical protein n=1 Tax=Ramlibacter sp. WS9 TaxID=1882741 RepID=UPI001142E66C|nr:hypothetical protein [Ramlibacter sp. WS9]ROZ63194.1 hypothetical protein EEB15_30090 [Ramlibacter sp. WS9]